MGLFGPPNVENMKAKGDVQGLIKAMSYQKDVDVRVAAARALGQIGDARAVEPLIEILNDRQGSASLAAIALGKIGDSRAVEPLIAALKDKGANYYPIRSNAADALGSIGDSRAVEPLVEALKIDMSMIPGVAAAIGKIGAPALEQVISLVKDKNATVTQRQRAIRALGEIGARLKDTALRDGVLEQLHAALEEQPSNREEIDTALNKIRNGKGEATAICARCHKPLKRLDMARGATTLGGNLPTLFAGVICNACGKVECSDCKGIPPDKPCSWCGGEVSPAYETRFSH
jgi:hypothetical protein